MPSFSARRFSTTSAYSAAAGTAVKIYTYLGELIYEGTADASGLAAWNGKNKGGRLAASDVYLALVQWGGQQKIFKLVVEK